MKSLPTPQFRETKEGFRQVLSDPRWPAKILLAGFLLINPFLVALAPAFFSDHAPAWVRTAFPWILEFNVLSFWFPLGFTYEVLRRARSGKGRQLPDWTWDRLGVFAYEGAVKLTIAVPTLLLPIAIWMAACYGLFIRLLGLPVTMLSLFLPPIMLVVIPFCGVACCRWLDGVPVYRCALGYTQNWHLFRRGWREYLIASAFILGVNAVTTSFFYTIPFGAIFGLCVADTWFGPIYAESVAGVEKKAALQPQGEAVFALE